MSLVNFIEGTKEDYEALKNKDSGTLYFLDDNTIHKGDELFGGDLTKETIADEDEVKNLVEEIFAGLGDGGPIASDDYISNAQALYWLGIIKEKPSDWNDSWGNPPWMEED